MERPGQFSGSLITQWLDPVWRKIHQSDPPFQYTSSKGEVIRPVDGYLTDYGSIPWPATLILPRAQYAPAFVIHDVICETKCLPRKRGDQILREAIYTLTCGDAVIRRRLAYLNVRLYAIIRRIR